MPINIPYLDAQTPREDETRFTSPSALTYAPPKRYSGLSKAARAALDRIVTFHNAGRPDSDHLSTDDLHELGLLLDACLTDHADPSDFAEKKATACRTRVGTIHTFETTFNPLMLLTNPVNGRTRYKTRHTRDTDLTVIGEQFGFPICEVTSAGTSSPSEALFDMVADSKYATGLYEHRITSSKDVAQTNSVGLHGVLKAGTVVPTRYQTPNGDYTWALTAEDMNRRLQMVRRALHEVTGIPFHELDHTLTHTQSPTGTLLRPLTAHDVEQIFRLSEFPGLTLAGHPPFPASRSDRDLEQFFNAHYENAISVRSFWRLLRVPANLAVAYDITSLSGAAAHPDVPSPMATVVNTFVKQEHLNTENSTPWEDEAQSFEQAEDLLRNMRPAATGGAAVLPVDTDDIDTLLNPGPCRWTLTGSAANDRNHPARITARTLAATLADSHDGVAHMAAIGKDYSAKPEKLASGIARSLIRPVLFPTTATKPEMAGPLLLLERAFGHATFAAVSKHPDGDMNPWHSKLDLPTDTLADGAQEELAAHLALPEADRPANWFGPHGRALLALAIICAATSPAGRLDASVRLTKDNPRTADRAGVTGEPPQILGLLLESNDGIAQLKEIVDAATATAVRTAGNLLDPGPDPAHPQPLTNRWLRENYNESLNIAVEPAESIHDRYDQIVQQIFHGVQNVVDLVTLLQTTDPDPDPDVDVTLNDLFTSRGFAPGDLKAQIDALRDAIVEAGIIARNASQ